MKPVDKIWMNGEMVAWDDARIHVMSHVIHYGFGVFEGIRSYEQEGGGRAVFRLAEHIRRLLDSAHILRLPCPYTAETWIAACEDILRVNGLKSAYLRPAHMTGYGRIGLAAIDNPPVSIVAGFEWGAYLGEEGMKNGIRAKISSFARHYQNAHMLKGKINGMYVNNILAKREAVDNGYEEAIMLDPQGYVAEASGENLFVVIRGEVFTPPTANVLGGITRESCTTILRDMGHPVTERLLARDELYIADEVFMCGTAAEVTPVREIDQRKIGTGRPGPIGREVQTRYLDAVRGKRPEYKHWLHPVD
ncbi:MAG: branched-chain amino acid transaminase [Planctomycetes bacterium]|nr:branched-chain amino acid transaminase [Planctomycetota bacterium]